jgi:hypothetical protein
MNLLRRIFGKRQRITATAAVPREAFSTVTFDNEGVTRTLPDGRSEVVTWMDLKTITIVTTDQGPFVDDVFWVLAGSGNGSGCILPSEAQGMKELLPRLQALPGFDNKAAIAAMASAQNANFVCWNRG